MIANEIAFGKSFTENILYNVRGKAGDLNPHKCEWHVARKLFTDDLDAAGRIMEATASTSRATKPVYHFSLDWDRSEERFLNKDKCIEAADTVLAKLGLREHQALYFWHVDADHPHMHVVVNRVNEQSCKAWDMWKSKEKLERATHEVARDMDFLQVPGRYNELEFEKGTSKDASMSRAERATEPEMKPWTREKVQELKLEMGSAFYNARSWDELSAELAGDGLELRPKGQGLILTDGHNYTQLSKLGRHVRLEALEEKFDERFAEFEARDPLKPVREHSPVESFDNLPDRIDQQIDKIVQSMDLPDIDGPHEKEGQSNDMRATELLAVLRSIAHFELSWDSYRSERELWWAEAKIGRQEKQLERAKELLDFHAQKSWELLFKADSKLPHDKTTDNMRETIKDLTREKEKTPKLKRLIKLLTQSRKRIMAAEKKRQRAYKTRQLEWRIYYRLQKMREAESRVQAHEFALAQAKAEFKAKKKAHERNTSTRAHLQSRRAAVLKGMPKEAILDARLSWGDKNRLLDAWHSEPELTRGKAKSKDRDHSLELDPFD